MPSDASEEQFESQIGSGLMMKVVIFLEMAALYVTKLALSYLCALGFYSPDIYYTSAVTPFYQTKSLPKIILMRA